MHVVLSFCKPRTTCTLQAASTYIQAGAFSEPNWLHGRLDQHKSKPPAHCYAAWQQQSVQTACQPTRHQPSSQRAHPILGLSARLTVRICPVLYAARPGVSNTVQTMSEKRAPGQTQQPDQVMSDQCAGHMSTAAYSSAPHPSSLC